MIYVKICDVDVRTVNVITRQTRKVFVFFKRVGVFGVRVAQSVYNSCWAVSELHCLPSAECLKLKACVCLLMQSLRHSVLESRRWFF